MARASRGILSRLFTADTAASTGKNDNRNRWLRNVSQAGSDYKSREAHVLARIHLKVEHE